jgi:TRAP-type C4-dicarboxylate transport system substrate-binding protein
MKREALRVLLAMVSVMFFLVAVPLQGSYAQTASEKKIVWKVFTASTPSMPIGKIYEWMGQRLSERTKGGFTLRVYYAGQLPYKTTDEIPIVRDRRVEMVDAWDLHGEGVADWIGVLTLPTIYSSVDEAKRIDRSVVIPFIDKEFRKNFNCFVLYRILWNTQATFSTKKLTGVADLKGQRIRSPMINQQALINKLGGVAVYIDWGEAVTAYSRGTVDGGTAGVSMAANAGWFDYTKWGWDSHLGFAFGGALVNVEAFNALPKDWQKLLLDVGKDTYQYAQKAADDATQAGWDRAKEKKVTVSPLSATDSQKVQAAGTEVTEKWLAGSGRTEQARQLYSLIETARK